MDTKRLKKILILLFLVRVVLSLTISDGKLRSDSLNYFGLSLNLIDNFTFTAITPIADDAFSGGVTVDEFFEHFEQESSPYRRLMNFQWLHSLLFIPVILLFKSLYGIIIVNNILFFAAGYFLFDLIKNKVSHHGSLFGWGVFLFFPPFFYLTNQFYSEPLFVFLLSVIISGIVNKKTGTPLFLLSVILLCVTRGFGILFITGCLLSGLLAKEYRTSMILTAGVIGAILLNFIVDANYRDPNFKTIESPPPVIHSIYFTNTTNGNGDNDLYLAYPEKQNSDRYFAEYIDGQHTSLDLLTETLLQNIRDPGMFFTTAANRVGAYFLNIIPDSWNYGTKPDQSMVRKILWSLQNGGFLFLLWIGLPHCGVRYRRYFLLLFWISFAVHLLALSRYRYFQPVLIAGIPAITAGLSIIFDRMKIRTKKNALPD